MRAASPHRLTVQVGRPAARTGFQKLSLGPTGWRPTAFSEAWRACGLPARTGLQCKLAARPPAQVFKSFHWGQRAGGQRLFQRLGGRAGYQPAPAYNASWPPGRPHRFSKAFTGANGLAANGFFRGLEGVRAASPHRLTVQVGSPAARPGFQKLSLGPTGWRPTAC